jgi:formyltetrahydrofolate deformylase
MNTDPSHYILTLVCADARGIVAGVAGFITQQDGFIVESAQFGDASTGKFFLRMEFIVSATTPSEPLFRQKFAQEVAEPFAMQWQLHSLCRKQRVLILASKYGHCVNDLLHRYHIGGLNIEIPAIVSNHPDLEQVAQWYHVPFYCFPTDGKEKAAQEQQIKEVIAEQQIDLVVLARYMQVLSPELCTHLAGKAINIHHSFLPSFKGAKPYHQAFDRGVKIIGATAHYVTSDLDEGPIIEQEVARVDHTQTANDLVTVGRDIECQVLARAVKYHTEHRVLLNGHKTVVFR